MKKIITITLSLSIMSTILMANTSEIIEDIEKQAQKIEKQAEKIEKETKILENKKEELINEEKILKKENIELSKENKKLKSEISKTEVTTVKKVRKKRKVKKTKQNYHRSYSGKKITQHINYKRPKYIVRDYYPTFSKDLEKDHIKQRARENKLKDTL